ncbi:hypothetical protein QA601_18645 [Chitinispirillales bacterium ANBcel5]|uniref:hypothetical protein n=1 Tax=Cellulosispirillum alkaliphilum TaxID=3039283 RepID=UPI002A52CB0F|nr:hypothetical protein [Chitinispirillales bacterium ANBcel5]
MFTVIALNQTAMGNILTFPSNFQFIEHDGNALQQALRAKKVHFPKFTDCRKDYIRLNISISRYFLARIAGSGVFEHLNKGRKIVNIHP